MPILIFLLVLIDTIFTAAGISHHIIGEANPVMAYILDDSLVLFVLIKLSLPIFLVVFYRKIKAGWIHVLLKAAAALYLLVDLYHLLWILPLYV
ncbi:DUF5658 family protein [Actinomycetes bacterium NPDC127524]